MKAYGVKRKDFGCCPGHDKYPREKYNTRASEHARSRDKKNSHSRARATKRLEIHKISRDLG